MQWFDQALQLIWEKNFLKAIPLLSNFLEYYPEDPAALYNLAISYEGSDRYRSAVYYYQAYLNTGDTTKELPLIRELIETLKKDYEIYIDYQKKILVNDLSYLEHYYELLFNSSNVPMATEFIGFISEKYYSYNELANLLDLEDEWLEKQSTEIASDLIFLAQTIKRSPQHWTENAIAYLGPVVLKLEELVQHVMK